MKPTGGDDSKSVSDGVGLDLNGAAGSTTPTIAETRLLRGGSGKMKNRTDKKWRYRAAMSVEDVDFLARVKYAIDSAPRDDNAR